MEEGGSEPDMIQSEETNQLISFEPTIVQRQAEDLKAMLSDAQKRLETEPFNEDFRAIFKNTLIEAKLFFLNVAKEGLQAEEVKITERATRALDMGRDGLTTVRFYNELIFPILGRGKYKFGQRWGQDRDFKKKILERLQIESLINLETDSYLNKDLTGSNVTIRKTGYIYHRYTTEEEQFLPMMIGGYPGQGKSSLGLSIVFDLVRRKDGLAEGEKLKIKRIQEVLETMVIYIEDPNFKNDVMTLQDSIRMVDESFFMVFNEETMKRTMRDLTKNLYASRNRRNVLIFNISDLYMATRPLQKLILPYYIILRKGEAQFLCKSKMPISSKDPLFLAPLEDAQTEKQAEKALAHNPNFLTSFKFDKLPDRVERIYKRLKEKAQGEKAEIDKSLEVNTRLDEIIYRQTITEYQKGNHDIVKYLMDEHGYRRAKAKKIEEEVIYRVRRDERLKQQGLYEAAENRKPIRPKVDDEDEEDDEEDEGEAA